MELKIKISELQDKALNIKNEINSLILSMPDNSDITRMEDNPNCFVVSVRTLIKYDNWDTTFYDYRRQQRKLVEKVNETEITNIVTMLEEAIDKKFITVNKEKIMLHPEVINELKRIL